MIQNLISMFRMAVVQFQNLRDFYSTSGGFQATILIRHKYCQGKTTQGPSQACSQVQAENYRSENRNYRNKQEILQIVRVTSSNTPYFTKNSQNMPTFQSPPTKATRPKAKIYNFYMVASEILALMAISITYCIPRTLM